VNRQKPYQATRGLEVQAILGAERQADPFFIYRDPTGELLITEIAGNMATIGRGTANTVALPWDGRVSRLHAEVSRRGPFWTIMDSGLSSNGTFVNQGEVEGRARISDGDEIRVGETELMFRVPVREEALSETITTVPPPPAPELGRSQLAVLRVLASVSTSGSPPSNIEIAQRLGISIDAVKGHIRSLSSKFGVHELPPDERRRILVERAIAAGIVSLPPLSVPGDEPEHGE
jgi:pSer/pThr/pTyr-binding forkhead associated (FHA) protein